MFALGAVLTVIGFIVLVIMYLSADRRRKIIPTEKPVVLKPQPEIIVRSTSDVSNTAEYSIGVALPQSTCFFNECECYQARFREFQISLSSKVQVTA